MLKHMCLCGDVGLCPGPSARAGCAVTQPIPHGPVMAGQPESRGGPVGTSVLRDLDNTSSEDLLSRQDEAPKTSQLRYTRHKVTAKLLPV